MQRILILAILVIPWVIAGCERNEPPEPVRPPPVDLESLVDRLEDEGASVNRISEISQPFIEVRGHRLTVDGDTIQAFEYSSQDSAAEAASRLATDERLVGSMRPPWAGPPRIYHSGRLLVLYGYDRPATRQVLRRVLSSPVARAGEEETPASPTGERTPAKEGTLNIEGMEESMTFRLYQSPSSFPIPFTTYLPHDVRAEEVDDMSVRFTPTSAESGEAVVRVILLPEATSDEEAHAAARSLAETYGRTEPVRQRRHSWAFAEYVIVGRGLTGSVILGRKEDRLFHVHIRYPVEMEEGWAPRAESVLKEWRWEDTGRGLAGDAG